MHASAASFETRHCFINNFVKGQGDITWGAVWGGSKPADGIVTGRGITEYHHFEIRADLIPKYWEPVKDELVKFGFKNFYSMIY